MFDEPSSYLDVKQRLKCALTIRSLLSDDRYSHCTYCIDGNVQLDMNHMYIKWACFTILCMCSSLTFTPANSLMLALMRKSLIPFVLLELWKAAWENCNFPQLLCCTESCTSVGFSVSQSCIHIVMRQACCNEHEQSLCTQVRQSCLCIWHYLHCRYIIVVEHDLSVLDYLSDYICCLYGAPGAYGVVTMPFSVREGEIHGESIFILSNFTPSLLFYSAGEIHWADGFQ